MTKTTKRSATEPGSAGGAHSRIGVGIGTVSIKFAQAVIAEAEPHRRRFPNFCLRKVLAITSPAMAFTGYPPTSGRSGEERDPAGDAALGKVVLKS
jgi:hypothetical protein